MKDIPDEAVFNWLCSAVRSLHTRVLKIEKISQKRCLSLTALVGAPSADYVAKLHTSAMSLCNQIQLSPDVAAFVPSKTWISEGVDLVARTGGLETAVHDDVVASVAGSIDGGEVVNKFQVLCGVISELRAPFNAVLDEGAAAVMGCGSAGTPTRAGATVKVDVLDCEFADGVGYTDTSCAAELVSAPSSSTQAARLSEVAECIEAAVENCHDGDAAVAAPSAECAGCATVPSAPAALAKDEDGLWPGETPNIQSAAVGEASASGAEQEKRKSRRKKPTVQQIAACPMDEDDILSGCYWDKITPGTQNNLETLDGIGDLARIMLHADVLESVAGLLDRNHEALAKNMDSVLLIEVVAQAIVTTWASRSLSSFLAEDYEGLVSLLASSVCEILNEGED